MFIYLHNPRCSKSRQGLKLLEEKGVEFEVREYLKNPLNLSELRELSQKLQKSVLDFTRTKEAAYQKGLSEKELFELMAENPVLMERPILMSDKTAALGRPPELLLEIL